MKTITSSPGESFEVSIYIHTGIGKGKIKTYIVKVGPEGGLIIKKRENNRLIIKKINY